MRQVKRFSLVLIAAVILVWIVPAGAEAAKPCKPLRVSEGAKARVATVGVRCARGRKIATTYYERLSEGDHWDGKAKGAIFYKVERFRCFTGLGGTEMMCQHHNRWVLASTRPEDHPGAWHVAR